MWRKQETHMSDLKHHSSKQIPANCYHTVTALCCLKIYLLLELAFCVELNFMQYCFIYQYFLQSTVSFLLFSSLLVEYCSKINVTCCSFAFSLGRIVDFMLCLALCRPASSSYEFEQEACNTTFCKPGPEESTHRL